MYIKNLSLKDYRNYDSLNVDFDKNVNIIIGNNAQGKTNLIESLYVTSFGKSFRTNRDSELVKFDKDFAKINIEAEKDVFAFYPGETGGKY
ncbi:MAG: AAA family ATPase, partial [Clostridia bacterium]|nr:AAA family ATPase [Clostridia bacterium]